MAEVSQSAGKKAKSNFEKVAKKKPDPAGLALAEEAQAALTGKDFAKAKALYEQAQALCEASDAKAVKAPKPQKPQGAPGGGGGGGGGGGSKPPAEEDVEKEVSLPQP